MSQYWQVSADCRKRCVFCGRITSGQVTASASHPQVRQGWKYLICKLEYRVRKRHSQLKWFGFYLYLNQNACLHICMCISSFMHIIIILYYIASSPGRLQNNPRLCMGVMVTCEGMADLGTNVIEINIIHNCNKLF